MTHPSCRSAPLSMLTPCDSPIKRGGESGLFALVNLNVAIAGVCFDGHRWVLADNAE